METSRPLHHDLPARCDLCPWICSNKGRSVQCDASHLRAYWRPGKDGSLQNEMISTSLEKKGKSKGEGEGKDKGQSKCHDDSRIGPGYHGASVHPKMGNRKQVM